jgi:hypothetical protein
LKRLGLKRIKEVIKYITAPSIMRKKVDTGRSMELIHIRINNVKNDIYRELKKLDYDLYYECIHKANAIAINNHLSVKDGANLEATMVELALKIKKEK